LLGDERKNLLDAVVERTSAGVQNKFGGQWHLVGGV
jgi:hypothetical protein